MPKNKRRGHGQESGELELFARCASGFERVLSDELRRMGCRRVRPLKGGVAFFGPIRDAYRACLWSRVATRVQLVLARIEAHDADALYQGARSISWERHVSPGATIAVEAHGENPNLRNTQFTALKVKDAICDRLVGTRGSRPNVDAKDPDLSVDVSLHEDRATIYLNLSGPSLHRRGYREAGTQTEAPLKETLAAGILLAAGWHELAREGASFADPMCGSGTLAVEAALIAADVAPGIFRTRWGFASWVQHDKKAWSDLMAEARARADAGRSALLTARDDGNGMRIVAGDTSRHAIQIARDNARRAGVDELIEFYVGDASELGKHLSLCSGGRARGSRTRSGIAPTKGLLATNPPYGMRLQSAMQLPKTYESLARAVASLPAGWKLAAITPDAGIDTALGQAADELIACHNGPIRAHVRIYGVDPSKHNELEVVSLGGTTRKVAVADKNSAQFASRLRKVGKERAKWARKAGVTCYRIYDADLPEYALSVDVYQGAGPDEGAFYARVEEKHLTFSADTTRTDRRHADALAIIPAVLDIDRDHIFAKMQPRDKGAGASRQARGTVAGGAALGVQADPHVVRVAESGLTLEVDLAGPHDTGVYLDHRATREMLGKMAQGKRFLSLFSYSGAASVHAAAGGAADTTTVDPSKAYAEWARRNLEANGFVGRRHRVVCQNPLEFVRQEAASGARYDLVFLDPPESVANDPASLLAKVARILAQEGVIVFCSSRRNFSLDYDAVEAAGFAVEDVTAKTVGHDFSRTPKVHRCYLVTKR